MTIVSAPERCLDVHSDKGEGGRDDCWGGQLGASYFGGLYSPCWISLCAEETWKESVPACPGASIGLQFKLIQEVVRNLLRRKGEGKTTW